MEIDRSKVLYDSGQRVFVGRPMLTADRKEAEAAAEYSQTKEQAAKKAADAKYKAGAKTETFQLQPPTVSKALYKVSK